MTYDAMALRPLHRSRFTSRGKVRWRVGAGRCRPLGARRAERCVSTHALKTRGAGGRGGGRIAGNGICSRNDLCDYVHTQDTVELP